MGENPWHRPKSVSALAASTRLRIALCSSSTLLAARRKRAYSGRQPASHSEFATVQFMWILPLDSRGRLAFRPIEASLAEISQGTEDIRARKRPVAVAAKPACAAPASGSSAPPGTDGV